MTEIERRNKFNTILTPEFLREKYETEKLPIYKIAEIVGCDNGTVDRKSVV